MKIINLIAVTIMVMMFSSSFTYADTWVNGYTRSDGTYVQGTLAFKSRLKP